MKVAARFLRKYAFLSIFCFGLLFVTLPLPAQMSGSESEGVDLCFTIQNQGDFFGRDLESPQWELVHDLDPFCHDSLNFKKLADLYSSKRQLSPLDQIQIVSLGVDPATLTPKGIDLEIFPSIPLSEFLALKPALAYSPDSIFSRNGNLSYGAPKSWKTHYGELVRVIASTRGQRRPLGTINSGLNTGTPLLVGNQNEARDAIPTNVQTYFVNASGQEVGFYPDPAFFVGSATPYVPQSRITTWFAESGNYRLREAGASEVGDFIIDTPNGLRFHFFQYLVSPNGERETLSIHYRTEKIVDLHGNYLEVSYDGSSLRTTGVIAKTATDDFVNQIQYRYSNGRLKSIRAPRYQRNASRPSPADINNNGKVNIFEFRYPDESAELAALNAAEGQDVSHRVTAAGDVELTPLDTAVGAAEVVFSAGSPAPSDSLRLTGIDLASLRDSQDRPLMLHGALDHTPGLVERAKSMVFGVTLINPISNTSETYYLTLGNMALVQAGSENPQSPGYNLVGNKIQYGRQFGDGDHLLLTFLGPTRPPRGDYSDVPVSIYPLLKNGDKFVDTSGNSATVNIPDWDSDPMAVNFDPSHIPLSSPLPPGTAYHVREDNLNRVAEIIFPQSAAAPQGTQKQLRIRYDDRTLNHQEIEIVQNLDRSLGPLIMSQTSYRYQRIRTLQHPRDFDGSLVPPLLSTLPPNHATDWLPCIMDGTRRLNGTGREFAEAGVSLLVERELDVLRRKTVTYRNPLDNSSRSLISHYGGAYHFGLIGRKHQFAENDPSSCTQVQWAVDGKPFSYTWEILPDGSAHIFDLSPEGLNIDPILAHLYERKQVFKTYRFDTGFQAWFQANFDEIYDDDMPFYRFLPLYSANINGTTTTSPTLEELAEHFELDPNYPVPTLAQLFAAGAQTKCYQADITTHETVPLYQYRQSTDVTHDDDYFKPETLKVIHGLVQNYELQIPGDPGGSQSHLRTSAIRFYTLGAQVWSNSDWHDFLRGLKITPDVTFGITQDIPWTHGGRQLGRFDSYFERDKVLKLQPHFVYRLRNLDGFSWEPGNPGHIQFSPADHFIEGSRHSNGGYLGKALALSTEPAGDTTIRLSSGTQLAPLLPGDILYHRNLIYSITGVSGLQVTFTPALRHDLAAGTSPRFYRYFNPITEDTTGRYAGYDHFGNKAYQAMYYGASGLDWTSTPEFPLEPWFFGTDRPHTLQWNDSSTGMDNNDEVSWRYFGRVSKFYQATALPFFTYNQGTTSATPVNATLSSDPDYQRFYVTYAFDDSAFPWKPTQSVEYYLPVAEGSDLPAGFQHDEDRITTFTYYNNSLAPTSLSIGRPRERRTFRRSDTSTFSATRDAYNTLGILKYQDEIAVKAGQADFGSRTWYIPDGATGLVFKEERHTAAVNNPTGSWFLATTLIQETINRDFDRLARETRSWRKDAAGNLFGPVSHTIYHSPWQAETRTTQDLSLGSSQLSLSLNYLDGLSRPILQFSQFGTSTDFDAGGSTYDDLGRLERTYTARPFPSLPASLLPVPQLFGPSAAHSRHFYNQRGESIGQVTYSEGRIQSSNWTHPVAAADGATTRYDFQQDDDQGRVSIKTQGFNAQGNLVWVRDYEDTAARAILPDWNTARAYIASRIASLPSPLTHADYQYDRFDNIWKAEVHGEGTVQTRIMRFDQRNRLRYESHPEMRADAAAASTAIAYDDFDLFGNPSTRTQGGRVTQFQYTARGDSKSIISGDQAVSYFYPYEKGGATYSERYQWPRQPHLMTATDSRAGQTPLQLAYLHTYHSARGLLISRELLHGVSEFTPGFSSDFTATTSGAPNKLRLDYTHDAMGRVDTLTYPSAPRGHNQRTALDLIYHNDKGLLSEIRETGFAGGLPFVQNVQFGIGGRVTNFHFLDLDHGRSLTLDDLARIQYLEYAAPDQGFQQHYRYDPLSRITGIDEDGSSLYQYSYDALGELVTGALWLPGQAQQTYQYIYDDFGNLGEKRLNGAALFSGLADPETNHLAGAGFAYNAQGEWTSGRRDGHDYNMAYNGLGRLAHYDFTNPTLPQENQDRDYYYDPFGMRTLVVDHVLGKKTLYFYDENNRVLEEHEAELGQSGNGYWERGTIYFDGKSAITLEADTQAGANPPASPPQPLTPEGQTLLVLSPEIEWPGGEAVPHRYDFQISGNPASRSMVLSGHAGPRLRLPSSFPFGKYQIRARAEGEPWSDWTSMVYTDPASRLLAGDYPCQGNPFDRSHFQNHGTLTGGIPITSDLKGGFILGGNGHMAFQAPHQFRQKWNYGTLYLWFKADGEPVPGNTPNQVLAAIGPFAILIHANGAMGMEEAGNLRLFSQSATPKQWQFLTVVYGGGGVNCYLNGEKVLGTWTSMTKLQEVDVSIGGTTQPGEPGFKGAIDDIKFYNTHRTLKQIGEDYDRGRQ